MAFTKGNDVNILQAADSPIVNAGLGNDKYILAAAGMSASQKITISDKDGINTLQLIGGLAINSSKVAGTELQLKLSNGAVVNLSYANKFTFEVGGDPFNSVAGVTQTYAQFVTKTLGFASVPTSGVVDSESGIGITINANGTATAAPVTTTPVVEGTGVLVVGTSATVNATDAADVFSLNVTAAKATAANTQKDIVGFAVAADQLVFSGLPTALKGVAPLNLFQGIDGIAIQTSPINNSTLITLGSDLDGNPITLNLVGVTDATLVNVNVI